MYQHIIDFNTKLMIKFVARSSDNEVNRIIIEFSKV